MEERPDQHTGQTLKHSQCLENAQLQLHQEVSHLQNQEDNSGYPLQELCAICRCCTPYRGKNTYSDLFRTFHTFTTFPVEDRAKCPALIGHLALSFTRKVKKHEIS